ncbi:signaling protein [Pirellulimonas nuda]|nr:signaling protein [Pirellulimonas nuda]
MCNRFLARCCGTAVVLLVPLWLPAAEIFVATTGDDAGPGTRSAPLRTLAAARDAAREFVGRERVTVLVADGVYYLPEPLVFTPDDSGSEQFPVIYRSENEGGAALSGGTRLRLKWRPYRDGIMQATAPEADKVDQLFVGGVRQRMARYPNYDAHKKTDAYQGFAADAFSKQRAARWADPAGGYIHAMHRSRWGGYHYRITGKKPSGEVQYEGGWQNNRQMGMHEDFRMVENIFEELDAPGEWFHNAASHTLYYWPEPGVDLSEANIEVVRLSRLVDFQGSEAAPVRFITLQGFVVRHAARTFMQTNEPLLRSDWAIHRDGAFLLTGTEDVSIVDSEFDQVGGNAIFVNNYNRRTRVLGCHLHDVGASGVCFVGDPDAVRDPLFEYREKNDLATIDRTPGPKTNNYPAECEVADCLIHGVGRVERQPAGVQVAMASEITIRDTSIYDCDRAGINIGDGCWGGHLIERCDVFDTVLETHDHGSFNSWGRDRFWRSDRDVSQKAIDAEPSLPFLDAVKTTVIRDSRWRCDHGWDIDLDDGSSNYDIYNNLLLQGGLKLREGFRRRAWNNVAVNNGFHPHVWYNHSEDEVFANIFMAAHRGARMPSETAKGKRVDGNLFYSADPAVKNRFTQFGWDVHSVVGDPMFVDPAGGDFRVEPGSPALDVGFKNFPMDRFGVKKPSLKAIARTPVIPAVRIEERRGDRSRGPARRAAAASYWLGATLHDLFGEEYSAYGVRKEDGGVALAEAPSDCEAVRCGLRQNDLVQALNGVKVANTAGLLTTLAEIGDEPLVISVVRDQQTIKLTLPASHYIALESAGSAEALTHLPGQALRIKSVTANQRTLNEPLESLVDGRLTGGYGPVFANGTFSGAYKADLGATKPVTAIRSWSSNTNGNRGAQRVALYGSRSAMDPGWDLSDRERFTPLGTIDTTGLSSGAFNAAGLHAPKGRSLGEFRWILWSVSPVTPSGENTSFQELAVEARD